MHGLKAKTLRRMLKKAGLKTKGRKATLTKRAKSAHLIRGGYSATSSSLGSAEESMPLTTGQAGGAYGDSNQSFATMEGPGIVGHSYMLSTGGRRRSHTVKTKVLKRLLKKAGLKTSGRKAALTKRAKSAHLIRGGASSGTNEQMGIVAGHEQDGVWGSGNR